VLVRDFYNVHEFITRSMSFQKVFVEMIIAFVDVFNDEVTSVFYFMDGVFKEGFIGFERMKTIFQYEIELDIVSNGFPHFLNRGGVELIAKVGGNTILLNKDFLVDICTIDMGIGEIGSPRS
jgi:hypothetical protein